MARSLREADEEIERLNQQVQRLQQEVSKEKASKERLRESLKLRKDTADEARLRERRATSEKGELEKLVEKQRFEKSRAIDDNEKLKERIASLELEINSKDDEILALKAASQGLEDELLTTRVSAERRNSTLDSQLRRHHNWEAERAELDQKIADMGEELERHLATIEAQRTEQKKQVEKSRHEKKMLESDLAGAHVELDEAKAKMEQLQEKHDSTLKEMVIRADMPAEFNSRTLRQKDRRIRDLEKVVQQLREKYADLEEEHETVLSGLNSPRDDDMRSGSPPMSTLHQRTLSDELSAVRLVGSSSPELGLARSAAGSGGRAASAEPSPMAPRAAVRSSSQGTPSSSQLSPLVPTGNPWLSMTKHISTLQEEKTALKEEAAQLRAKAQQADEQLAAAQTRVAQLEGECGELRSQKALQDGEVQALTAELAVRQADKAQLEARVGELDGRARNMGESVAALEVELKIERAQQAERAEEVARLKREMQALQAERTEMENRYAELMCECHSYRANVDELQGLCAELAAARQALETRLQAAESGQGQEQAAAQELRNLLRQAELDSRHEREKCKLRIDALQREVNDLRRLKDEHAREREQDKNQMLAWDHSLTLLAERLSGSGRGSGEEGGVEGGADGEVEAASAAARGGVEAQMAAAMAEAQRRIASELQQLQQRSREQRSELAATAASTLDRLQAQFASDRRAVTELEGKYKQAGEALRKRLERDMADMRAASQDWQQRALQVQQENVRLLQTVNAREADVQRLKQQVQDLLRDGRRGEDGKGGVGQGRGAGTAAVDGLGPLYDELDRLRRENLRLQAESAGKARVEEGGGRWGEGEAALALLGGLLLVLLLLQLVVSISSVPGDSTNSASIAGRLLGELGLWLRRGSELLWPA